MAEPVGPSGSWKTRKRAEERRRSRDNVQRLLSWGDTLKRVVGTLVLALGFAHAELAAQSHRPAANPRELRWTGTRWGRIATVSD